MNQGNVGYDGLTHNERFVAYALSIGAIEFVPEGRQLKSGRISPYFFNSGLFNTGKTIGELGKVYASKILNHYSFASNSHAVVFGPAYKGIPLSVVTAVELSRATGENIGYAFDRKEEKTHGDGGIIVGASLKDKNVVVVDDVMTTGTSSGEAVETIYKQGGYLVACVIAFDRRERVKESDLSAVQEFQHNYGIPVYAAATLADLISYLRKCPPESGDDNVGEFLEKVLAYQEEYGVK